VNELLLAGFGLGVLLAAQIGPVTLLVLRSILRGGRALVIGFAMAGAVALTDVLYATVGLAGAGELLQANRLQLALGLVSGAILVAVGVQTIWIGMRARFGLEPADDVLGPRRAFVTAVAATALNPLTIALWTVSFPAAAPDAAGSSIAHAAAVLAGVALGTLTWYCGLAASAVLARDRIGPRFLAGIDIGTGGVLVAYGGLLGYRALDDR
jgi:threonine/homoserine/homoserine lactone efflux protein